MDFFSKIAIETSYKLNEKYGWLNDTVNELNWLIGERAIKSLMAKRKKRERERKCKKEN